MQGARARLGILISGRGSNMQALATACVRGDVPAEVAVVVSNVEDAAGVTWAREHGLDAVVLPHRDFTDRTAHDMAIVERLEAARVEWVCLAGYMRLLSPSFVGRFPRRILNIHPSLLPAFPGLHAQRQALDYGVQVTGCTVHLVDTELDHGPIVLQRPVTVRSDDTEEGLSARILEQEHLTYAEGLRRLLTESWRLEGRKLVFGG